MEKIIPVTEKIKVGDVVNVYVRDNLESDLFSLKYSDKEVLAVSLWSFKLKGTIFNSWFPINQYYRFLKVYSDKTNYVEPKENVTK